MIVFLICFSLKYVPVYSKKPSKRLRQRDSERERERCEREIVRERERDGEGETVCV